ncbi:MAG TPA: biopolymer transporter ExbD [Calditrichia bacterium]|nr:biopolymer transporter ExbD [Calditrichota bacterium]HQU73116.1 biopolymer transporter ExbD [Calditrichia bacterium]HQV31825.1 biopolymer transporter ExbD [Calditrichia bacterium]
MLKKRPKEGVEIPSSSLADIAFLLLVFFLVCTQIDVDKGVRMVLPPVDFEDVKIDRKNIANLLVNDEGAVLLNNENVRVGEISRIIKEKLAENDKLIVSVKTTRKAKYDVYISVLDQLKIAGATRISIADPTDT